MQKLIDEFKENIGKLDNVERVVFATYDGLPITGVGVSEEEVSVIAAFLSKYRESIVELSGQAADSEFQIGYYLTKDGFMVIALLGEEAVLQVVAKSRKNTGIVLREVQRLRDKYNNRK